MPTSTFQKQGTVTPVAPIHVDYVAITSVRQKNAVAGVAQAARVSPKKISGPSWMPGLSDVRHKLWFTSNNVYMRCG